MRLIGLAVVLTLRVFGMPLVAEAQQAAKVPRVGVLRPGNPPPADFVRQSEAFERGLRELGLTPGTSIRIEYRYAEGRLERMPELAADLVRLSVDVIVAGGSDAVRAAQQATRTIPIVISTLPDPVGQGLVKGVARPGGNTTGIDLDAEDLAGKQLELLKEVIPSLSRVAMPRNPAQFSTWDALKRKIDTAARALKTSP